MQQQQNAAKDNPFLALTPDDLKGAVYTPDNQENPFAALKPEDLVGAVHIPEGGSGFLRQAADIPTSIGSGVITGLKGISDVFGADNPVSQTLGDYQKFYQDALSPEAKADQFKAAAIMREAEGKGITAETLAGLRAFTVNPVDQAASMAGTMAPIIATGVAGRAVGLGGKAVQALQVGVGGVQGAGIIKGDIYDATKQYLLDSGVDPVRAEEAAVKAQEYGGENLGNILAGAGLGAVASGIGVESIINKVASKGGKFASGRLAGLAKGAIAEGLPEGAQGGQERYAQNVALINQGAQIDPMTGVISQATLEGTAGAVMGAPVGFSGSGENAMPVRGPGVVAPVEPLVPTVDPAAVADAFDVEVLPPEGNVQTTVGGQTFEMRGGNVVNVTDNQQPANVDERQQAAVVKDSLTTDEQAAAPVEQPNGPAISIPATRPPIASDIANAGEVDPEADVFSGVRRRQLALPVPATSEQIAVDNRTQADTGGGNETFVAGGTEPPSVKTDGQRATLPDGTLELSEREIAGAPKASPARDESYQQFKSVRRDAWITAREDAKQAMFSGQGKFTNLMGVTYLVTPSTDPDVLVRVTRIDRDGNPIGHDDFYDEEQINFYLQAKNNSGLVESAFEQARPDLAQGWKAGVVVPQGRKPHKFIYRLRLRPASIGTHPKGGTIVSDYEVEYDRPLTAQELSDFEMRPVGARPVETAAARPQQPQSPPTAGDEALPQEVQDLKAQLAALDPMFADPDFWKVWDESGYPPEQVDKLRQMVVNFSKPKAKAKKPAKGKKAANPIAAALDKYEGSGEIETAQDLADELEGIAAETDNRELEDVVREYRANREDHRRDYGMRDDDGGDAFVAKVKRLAASQPPPANSSPATGGEGVRQPTGGVDYYKQLGERDGADTSRKRMRSVPQNYKLAYMTGWWDAKKAAKANATAAQPAAPQLQQPADLAIADSKPAAQAQQGAVGGELHPSLLNHDGTPKDLYHGKAGEFDDADLKLNPNTLTTLSGLGPAWFTTNKKQATRFSVPKGNVMETSGMALRRPLVIEGDAQSVARGKYLRGLLDITAGHDLTVMANSDRGKWTDAQKQKWEQWLPQIKTFLASEGVTKLKGGDRVDRFDWSNIYPLVAEFRRRLNAAMSDTEHPDADPLNKLRRLEKEARVTLRANKVKGASKMPAGEALRLALESEGYDGVVLLNTMADTAKDEQGDGFTPSDWVIPFGAESVKTRLKRNLKPNSGAVDLDIINDLVDYGKQFYRAGMTFGKWAGQMVKEFGQGVAKYLRQAFDRIVAAYKASPWSSESGAVGNNPQGGMRGIEESLRRRQAEGKPRRFEERVKASDQFSEETKAEVGSTYTPISISETVQEAQAWIDANGIDAAFNRIVYDVDSGAEMTAIDHGIGLELAKRLNAMQQPARAGTVIGILSRKKTTAGQMINMAKVLSAMSPETVEAYAVNQIEATGKDVNPALLAELEKAKKDLLSAQKIIADLRRKASEYQILEGKVGGEKVNDKIGKVAPTKAEAAKVRVKLREVLTSNGTRSEVEAGVIQTLKDAGMSEAEATATGKAIVKGVYSTLMEQKKRIIKQVQDAHGWRARGHKQLMVKLMDGEITDDAFIDNLTRLAGVPSLTPEARANLQRLTKEFQAATDEDIKLALAAAVFEEVHSIVPPEFWGQVRALSYISMLLYVKTWVKNIAGNSFLWIANIGRDGFVNMTDTVTSTVTGKRTASGLAMGKRADALLTPFRDFKKGYEWNKRQYGEDRMKNIKAGLNHVRLLSKLTTQNKWDITDAKEVGRRMFSNRFLRGLETTLSIALGAADRAFWKSALETSLAQREAAAKINGEWSGVHTPEDIEAAWADAARAIFQDKNVISQAAAGGRQWLNWVSTAGQTNQFGLGTALLAFTQVPGSILKRGAFDWSPLGFINVAYQLIAPTLFKATKGRAGHSFDQQAFNTAFSEAMLGSTALFGMGFWLASMGIISAGADDDQDVAAANKAQGWGAYKINLSALKRMLMGDMTPQKPREHDYVVNYDWVQPLAIAVAAGAEMAAQFERDREKGIKTGISVSATSSSVVAGIKSLEDQPLVSGLSSFMKTWGYSGPYDAIAKTMLSIPSMFVPQGVRAASQYMDNTVREARGGDGLALRAWNAIAAQTPGVSDNFPARMDITGKPIARNDWAGESLYSDGPGWAAINLMNSLANPFMVSRVKSNPALAEVARLMQTTGETRQFPRTVAKTVEVNGQQLRLTNEQLTDYQYYLGNYTMAMFNARINSPRYRRMNDLDRVKLFAQDIEDINAAVKSALFGVDPRRLTKRQRVMRNQLIRSPLGQSSPPTSVGQP